MPLIFRWHEATDIASLVVVKRQHRRRVVWRRRTVLLLSSAGLLTVVLVVVLMSSSGRGVNRSVPSSTGPPASSPSTSSPALSTTSRPAPSMTTNTTVPTSPFGPSLSSYIADRLGTVSAAAENLKTGQVWTFGAASPQDEASIVKVDILETLLAQAHGAELSPEDQEQAQGMIEASDNDDATALWDAAGGTSGIAEYNAQIGLNSTTPSSCVVCPNFPWPGWGLSTTTAADQLTLLQQLVEPSSTLPGAQRSYALGLMENVLPSEAWGVSTGVPTGVTVALKNGWLPLDDDDSDWQINSIGWVSGDGADYLLAVLTTGNPSEQYGIDTVDQVSTTVWGALH